MNTYWLLYKTEHGIKRLLAIFQTQAAAGVIRDLHEKYKHQLYQDESEYSVEEVTDSFEELVKLFPKH